MFYNIISLFLDPKQNIITKRHLLRKTVCRCKHMSGSDKRASTGDRYRCSTVGHDEGHVPGELQVRYIMAPHYLGLAGGHTALTGCSMPCVWRITRGVDEFTTIITSGLKYFKSSTRETVSLFRKALMRKVIHSRNSYDMSVPYQ